MGAKRAGEILELAFGLYRRHLALFVRIMAPAAIIATAAGLPLRLQRARIVELIGSGADPLEALKAVATMLVGLGAVACVSMMAYGVAGGAVSMATEGAAMGGAMTAREAYAALGARAARTAGSLALLLLVGASLAGAAGALAAAPLAAVAFVAAGSLAGPIAAVMAMLLTLAAPAGVFIVLVARYGLVVQAVVLDDLGPIAALGRSSGLTRGQRGRVLLIFLIVSLLTTVGTFLIQGPFEIAGSLVTEDQAGPPVWTETLSALSGCFGGAALAPLLPIALTVLHRDLRERAPLQRSRQGASALGGAARRASDA